MALGATLLWLPLTAAAVGRGVFVKYRFTDKRISVITNAPWKKEQLDAAYQEVDDVQTVGRALGVWGDMVVTLKNGDKIEMRSLPKYDPSLTWALRPCLIGSSWFVLLDIDAAHFHMLRCCCVTQVHGAQTVHKRPQGCIGRHQNRQPGKKCEEVSKGFCLICKTVTDKTQLVF